MTIPDFIPYRTPVLIEGYVIGNHYYPGEPEIGAPSVPSVHLAVIVHLDPNPIGGNGLGQQITVPRDAVHVVEQDEKAG